MVYDMLHILCKRASVSPQSPHMSRSICLSVENQHLPAEMNAANT